MIKMIFHNFFFLLSIFSSILISISSVNWVWIWVGLEINMLSFIPLIKSVKSNFVFRVVECSVKYFIIQAIGSSLFLLGYYFFLVNFFRLVRSIIPFIFIFLSLLIKLGAAPFHFWFPVVIKGMSWFSCGILIVPQKVIPIFILRCILMGGFSKVLGLFSVIGAIVGGIGGFNQVNLRFILSYSSIGHIGWMLIGCLCSFNIFIIYFIVYGIISLGIVMLIYFNDLRKILSDRIYFKGFFLGIILFFFYFFKGYSSFFRIFTKMAYYWSIK